MEPRMRIAAVTVAAVALGAAGCLGPLVDDKPGASSHLLRPGSQVPSAADNPELADQIRINDGLDDIAFAMSGGVVPRGTGMSAGAPVRFWSFGPASRAPAPLYEFYARTESGLVRLDHPALVDALPGDPAYSPLHVINQVVVTDAYADQLITSMDALDDAFDLGLVEAPISTQTFVDSPIVLPNTQLDVGNGKPQVLPETVYARGYTITAFRLGGALGVQPTGTTGTTVLATSQVSFLRQQLQGTYNPARPIFEATIPTMPPPPMTTTYTPLSVVVNVDLAPPTMASSINRDSDLFIRSPAGEIMGTTPAVAQFQVTTSVLLLQLQFMDGLP